MPEIEMNFSKPQPRCYILELTPEDREIFRRWDFSPQFEAYYWFAAIDAEKNASTITKNEFAEYVAQLDEIEPEHLDDHWFPCWFVPDER